MEQNGRDSVITAAISGGLMELILMPVLMLIQFTVYLLMAIVGMVFNLLFRSDRANLNDTNAVEAMPAKPENPWAVFAYSLAATLILGLICGGLCYYTFETQNAFLIGFVVMCVFGLFSSITAATGEPPPM